MRHSIKAATLAGLAFVPLSGVASAQEIGSVAAVNRDIDGTPPDAPTRALLLGDRVIANERLISSPDGSGQMLFLDQTSLTVSPNSEIVLDQYVYDPDAGTGEIGLTVARGVMRMIGGRITKTTEARIDTPTATIGIRGGIGLIVVGEDGATRVMHVAGEYTRVEAGGETLNLTRPNALASVGQAGAPQYLGVASEAEVAALYNQMQGGGGGSDTQIDDETVESAGVSERNSEAPDAVIGAPISTAGERPASDDSVEVEELTIAEDTEVRQDVITVDEETTEEGGETDGGGPIDGGGVPPPENPFADFVGGVVLVDNTPFTDDEGVVILDPVAQNFLFADETAQTATSFEEGSLIVNLEDGTSARLPVPEASGFFTIDPAETESPEGPLFGSGLADLEAGLLAYYIRTGDGEIGLVLGAEPGPTQLAGLNEASGDFAATAFEVRPDLHISSPGTALPFLPGGLGEFFDTGEAARIFIVSQPGSPLFGPGAGASSDTGNRWLLPAFSISGAGQEQAYYMSVGATAVRNNGSGAPDLSSFARGSFRQSGFGSATRTQSFVGATSVSATDENGPTVFGLEDDYLLLGNSGAYAADIDDPDEETIASFVSRPGPGGGFTAYGNTHFAERVGAEAVNPTDRISIGATPADYVAETDFGGAAAFAPDEARFLSFGYSSAAAALFDQSGGQKILFRTAAFGGSSPGAAVFGLQRPDGAVVVDLDEGIVPGVESSPPIFGVRLAFGGTRSAVIDDARFGLREHPNPAELENVLLPDGVDSNSIDTFEGPLTGQPPDQFGESAWRGALISHGLADASALYPAGTPVTPEYLTWGWWTGQFRFADDDQSNFGGARLQFSLGTWVAGDRTDVLPPNGIATYNGPVTVNNLDAISGADFVDGGRFELEYDFSGAGFGTARFQDVLSLPDFDVSVDGSDFVQGANDYGGDRTDFMPGGDPTFVRVDGSFFDGPDANDARATAGSLRIENDSGSITATGTFWGEAEAFEGQPGPL